MLGLPRECVSFLLSLLGVAGAPALILTTPASVTPQDVEAVRAAYVAAARTFALPWQIRALVRAANATACLPAAYLRLCRAVFTVVRLCFRPVRAPGVRLAYPCFGEAAPGCLQLASPCSSQSAFAVLFEALGFRRPPPSPAGRQPRPQLRLAPCWAPCRPSCRLAAAQSRVLHGASYSGALASGHPRHTLLSSCPGGGSATGLCHHIWCPRCFRMFCRPGARC